MFRLVDLASSSPTSASSLSASQTTTTLGTSTACGQTYGSTSPSANSTASSAMCPQINLDLSNSIYPDPNATVLVGSKRSGTIIVQVCSPGFCFDDSESPVNIYQCTPSGTWSANVNDGKCVSQ
ncbi:Sushi domain-containing protein [Aphelenchoides besseyi]|nr:Sushi domain-containing protein [Aphelenchoides besseyi]